MSSKQEILGRQIIKRITDCDSTIGGTFVAIQGSQGSGKTSTMLTFVDNLLQQRPTEKIFWAQTYHSPMQFLKLSPEKWNILVQEGADVTFHDRDDDMKQIYPPVTYFTNYQDCYYKSLPGKCNAVFFKRIEQWMPFVHYLRKHCPRWKHIFVDEMGSICPEGTGGRRRVIQEHFMRDCAEIRKSLMNLMYNSQTITDVDYRVRAKVMIVLSLPGSKSDWHRRVRQSAIDHLEKDNKRGNTCWVEYDGQFGLVRMSSIYEPIPGYNWQANIPEEEDIFDIETHTEVKT